MYPKGSGSALGTPSKKHSDTCFNEMGAVLWPPQMMPALTKWEAECCHLGLVFIPSGIYCIDLNQILDFGGFHAREKEFRHRVSH